MVTVEGRVAGIDGLRSGYGIGLVIDGRRPLYLTGTSDRDMAVLDEAMRTNDTVIIGYTPGCGRLGAPHGQIARIIGKGRLPLAA